MKKKQVVVTGGAGYIGSHTVIELIHAGFHPIIVDNFSNSDRSVLNRIQKITGKEITCLEVDLCDKEKLFTALKNISIDGIIHFAAFKAVGESVQKPLKYYANNIASVQNIVEFQVNYGIQNLVFSSSCTVYGEPKNTTIVSEKDDANTALSPYGFTKIAGERILQDLAHVNSNVNALLLRYFNPIGAHPSGEIGEVPNGTPNNLLPYITQTAIGKQECLTINGKNYNTPDGTCIRDYIHVVDIAKAHVAAVKYMLENKNIGCDAINLGTGKGTSTLEMVQYFEEVSGQKLNWKFGPRRAGDVPEIFANTKKALNLLQWKAELSVKQAIKDAWNWEQKFRNETK